ncbi:hypothetical protein OIO90_002487 [Microbotryomycetes sp. JL221]|nr:hypothetical protein OIO90_002487 [Microbotryomycetes sp. JL221]
MAALERRSSSVSFPWPSGPSGATVTVKTRGDQVISSATSLQGAGVVHTQYEQDGEKSRILLRLNTIDSAATFESADAERALWSALFPYFARGQDAPASLDVECVLPSSTLHEALLRTGSSRSEDNYAVSRSALFQLFGYAQHRAQPAPFPVINTSAGHPLRPPKPTSNAAIYSRYVPLLDQVFRLEPCTLKHLDLLHAWLNDERVDKFWEEKGTIEQHHKFISDRLADPHTLSVIGSYFANSGDKVPTTEAQLATYSEIYWVKEDRLGPLMPDVREFDRGG